MTDETSSPSPVRQGVPVPKDSRSVKDRRAGDRREPDCKEGDSERRIGDRRKHDRRLIQVSKHFDFVRLVNEKGLNPYEKHYDRPADGEVIYQGKNIINLASVDYFNFAQHKDIKIAAHAAVDKYGPGGFSSKLSLGYLDVHSELELKLAEFMGKESVLIFNSGYLANLAMITSLMPRNATIFLDQKCHLSIHHACLLSGKKHYRYANNDMENLERLLRAHKDEPEKWIVTLGVFSSNGFLGKLNDIAVLARKYKARIFIDDAHGIGVYGSGMRGAADHFNVLDEMDLIMCPFQMAFGNIGAFVVGKRYLLQAAHTETWPYMFTYNIPPVNAACILKALEILRLSGPKLQKKLLNNVSYLRDRLSSLGYEILNPEGHIIPIIIGDEIKVFEFAKYLFTRGVWVQPFVHPAVPKSKATVRVTCTVGHSRNELDESVKVFAEAYRWLKDA